MAVVLAFAVYDRYVVEREVMLRWGETEKKLQVLSERQDALQGRVDYLNNEQGLEAEIRRHFDVAKEGEQVVILVGEKDTVGPTSTSPNTTAPKRSWWQIFSW
jgi:cell division protein FtsB